MCKVRICLFCLLSYNEQSSQVSMNLNQEMLNVLQTVYRQNEPLRLINDYHGLPVVYEAWIKELSPSTLRVAVHPHQAVCMMIENFTYISSASMPYVLRAGIQEIDFNLSEAVLTDFLFAPDTIGSRLFVRVEPEYKVQVVVSTRKSNSKGYLLDISEVGAGVCTFSALMYNPVTLKRGASVVLHLDLDEFEPSLEVKGEILYMTREGDTHRLGIRIEPEENARTRINQFVGRRKVNLLNELQALAEARHSSTLPND